MATLFERAGYRDTRQPLATAVVRSGLPLALFLVSYAHAAAPGFDCAKAKHEVEKQICRDDGLAALDRQLTETYRAAHQNFPAGERHDLKATQRDWIKGRNDCWTADNRRGCILRAYQTRITELQIQGGRLVVPEPIDYRCDRGKYETLSAVFYQQTMIPSVVLTRLDDQVIAFQVRSGSGAKYEGRNVSFWEHHGRATGRWNGEPYRCTARATIR